MELQTNPISKIKTPRVKSISGHPKTDEIVVCMFNGEVRLYNSSTLQQTRSAQISNVAIRTGVMVPSHDWILVGTDEGEILVLDIAKLSVINKIQAHDDFVRKIVVDDANKRFISVSDDNTTKLWSYKSGILLVRCYKDAKHFVMDACFYPGDHSFFLTTSLDCRIRLYSVNHEKVIRKYKGHERGVNCIEFLSQDVFVTGSDDHSIIVWDYAKGTSLATLKGHTGNVNYLYKLKNGFISCSEDSTARIWDDSYKMVDIKNTMGRSWCTFERNGKVFIGSDDELSVYTEKRNDKIAVMADNKVYFSEGESIKVAKLGELKALKEIGTLSSGFKEFSANENGKFLVAIYDNKFEVFSTLGLRKKFESFGSSFKFIGTESFAFKDGNHLKIFTRFEEEASVKISEFESILYIDENIIVFNTSSTVIIDRSSVIENNGGIIEDCSIINNFGIKSKQAFVFGDYLVLCDQKIEFYNSDFEKIAELEFFIKSYSIFERFLFFSTETKSFYCFIVNNKAYIYPLKFLNNIIGIRDGILIYSGVSIETFAVDFEYINFQYNVLSNVDCNVPEHMIDKAISFYEALEMHQKALDLCKDDNQKFEILLKLKSFEEAYEMANSPIKYAKLAKAFLKNGNFVKAADCFFKAGDISNCLLVDVFGNKKYLNEIGNKSKIIGCKNLAFLACYKNNDFESCKGLLKDTPFLNLFVKNYCE